MPDLIPNSPAPKGLKGSNISSSNPYEKVQSHRTPTCNHAVSNITSTPTNLHTLLLLSDSALPLGSFAFSSGLESYYAHQKRRQKERLRQKESKPAAFTQPVLSPVAHLTNFLNLSLLSTAAFALPYIFAAHAYPTKLLEIDDFCDASTTCAVARRASVAQGRALLAVWERSFSSVFADFTADDGDNDDDGVRSCQCLRRRMRDCDDRAGGSSSNSTGILSEEQDGNAYAYHHTNDSHENVSPEASTNPTQNFPKANTHTKSTTETKTANPAVPSASKAEQATHALSTFQSLLRNSSSNSNRNKNNESATTATHPDDFSPTPSAHYAPLWGAVTRAANLSDVRSAAYVFLFGHARAVISAGVRSGMLGPYQAQALLAGTQLRKGIEGLVADAQADVDADDNADMNMVGQVDMNGKNDDKDDRWMIGIERSAQAVPVMDLWMGRHELLYSRIFNS